MNADWVEELRLECVRTTQAATALRLGVSTTMVNQVIKGCYKGNLSRLEIKVRGELMNCRVNCPVVGEITERRCQDEQEREFAATNPMRVQLYRACRSGCPNARNNGGE